MTERKQAARLSRGHGPVLVEEGPCAGCRETVVCRRSTSEPTFDAEKRRELAPRIYDEYPSRSGIFDTVLLATFHQLAAGLITV